MRRVNSVENFWKRVQEYQQDPVVNKAWRKGQLYFNALYDVDPELANHIRGTSIDPLHQDEKIESFMMVVL